MKMLAPILAMSLAACSGDTLDPASPAAQASAATGSRFEITPWTLPETPVAAQPDLVTTADGEVLLSWIEPGGDGGHALKFARFDGQDWQAPREIARGGDWFVNWADTPHIVATEDGALWAHWLRKSASATYAYDVVLSRSGDGGATWAPPQVVNDDGTPTEHGFVSLWPQTSDSIGVAWLDGRNTAADPAPENGQGGHAGHGGGAMALRTALFDAALGKTNEVELDARTCDCCQTGAALTARGPLLVYRDRDEAEIRDIASTRLQDGAWTPARTVHDDRWTMPACPVNGPSVAARASHAWVAWYTAAGDVPTLRLAHSADAGDSFSAPVDVDRGNAVQGRAGVAVDAAGVWVSWMREEPQGQSLWIARHTPDLSRELQRLQVATLEGRGRATGFPQLLASDQGVLVAWTDVVDGKPLLRGARITSPGEAAGGSVAGAR
jgi:hypothetical protein